MNEAPDSATRRYPLLSWPTASLRAYLVIVSLFATVPLAVLMLYQVSAQVDNQRERAHEEMRHNAALLAQSVNRELLSSIVALNILAYSDELVRGDVDSFGQNLTKRPLPQASWSEIYLASLDGKMLFNTADPYGKKKHQRIYDIAAFLSHVKDQQAVVSNVVREGEHDFTTHIEVPVLIEGLPRFILGASIPVSVWQQLIADSAVAAPGLSGIIDRDFRMIARNGGQRFVGTLINPSNRALMIDRPSGTGRLMSREDGYVDAAWDTAPLSHWIVVTGRPAAPIDTVHQKTIATALATGLGCLLLGIFLALLIARRMTQPLRQLARNDLSPMSAPIAVREIALLRDALVAAQLHDKMARELLRKKRDLLAKKASEFEALLAGSPIGLAFAQDRLCQTVIHNDAMTRLFGSSDPNEATPIAVFHNGRPLPREEQPLQRAAARGETTHGMELELRTGTRPPEFVLVNAAPLYDEDHEPRGAIGAVIDITERKATEARLIAAEQSLRESQNLVDLAQESGHVGFFHYQSETKELAWTHGQAKLFAIETKGRVPLSTWTQRIDRVDWWRVARMLCRTIKMRVEMEQLNYCVLLPGGHSRWLSSRVRLIYSSDGHLQHIVGVTVDMSEQKRAENERDALIVGEQQARLEAEAANRSKDEFLAMLGHELRNPLSAISSGIEVLNRVDGATEAAQNARRIIDRQTRQLAHMVDDLLDVARVMTNEAVLPRHNFDLALIVQRVIAALEISNEFCQHEFVSDIQSVWVNANPTRIEQVVSNLIVNAIKYTPPGGRIEVHVRPQGSDALFQVKDNGIGIAPELLPKVFDLFVQGNRTLDRRGGGLGVGLTLARRLIELHDGNIRAENANPGTIMSVRLPSVTATPLSTKSPKSLPRSRCRSVAVVEDNEDVLQGLRVILELQGHVVSTASDGIKGLELILSTRPDVAIVDIGLPGLTGFDVAKRSRHGGYPGKMIALSGYGQEDDKRQSQIAGFDVHFLKPVSSNELLDAVASD